jgi:hypothetical protein
MFREGPEKDPRRTPDVPREFLGFFNKTVLIATRKRSLTMQMHSFFSLIYLFFETKRDGFQ